MRGKSILRQAFSFRYISSSSSSRIPLNRGKTLQNPNLPDSASYVFKPSFAEPDFAYYGFKPSYAVQPEPDFAYYGFKPSYAVQPEPPPVPENVIRVSSEEELNAALSKTEEESASAVFYFTTASCIPCLLIGPTMDELARRTPDLIIYKMYIDEEHIARRIKELNVTSVPTLHYFKEGKKVDEVDGGNATCTAQALWDVYKRIVHAMRDLYNMRKPKPEDSEEEVKEEIDAEDENIENIELLMPRFIGRGKRKG